MKPRHKLYIKLNLVSLVFMVVSFISVTLAWFAYSGLTEVATEVDVKAWYIELEQDGQQVSQNITISFSDIYPGMDIVEEIINIENLGDSDAQISYDLISARILDQPEDNYVVDGQSVTSDYVEDALSHEYPFHININLEKGYALAETGVSTFKVNVSWPLDSNNDLLDSQWGIAAYNFQKNEQDQKDLDPQYQIQPTIQVVINVAAEQYMSEDTSSDYNYNLGDEILFDVVNNATCSVINTTCLKTYVIDVDNKIGDTAVTLLPDPSASYSVDIFNNYNTALTSATSSWVVNNRALDVDDILKVIASDISNSYNIRSDLSDLIIGNVDYGTRIDTEVARAVSGDGYFRFVNSNFDFINDTNCYWTNSEYDTTNGFAVAKIDGTYGKIFKEPKANNCNIIPVILANKTNLQ